MFSTLVGKIEGDAKESRQRLLVWVVSMTCLIKIVGSINSRHGAAELAASLGENGILLLQVFQLEE